MKERKRERARERERERESERRAKAKAKLLTPNSCVHISVSLQKLLLLFAALKNSPLHMINEHF
jgi:hypothetical protein